LMPTEGISSCAAVMSAGSGVWVGCGVGLSALVGAADGSPEGSTDSVAVGDACATAVEDGSTMGGRLVAGLPSGERVPMIMRAIPTTPRTMGSPHAAIRLT